VGVQGEKPMKEPCGVGLVPWWFSPPVPLSRLPALLPELFPTSPSGSPWGGGEVGNSAGSPPQGVFAGRRDNGCARRAHNGRTSHPIIVRSLSVSCAAPARQGVFCVKALIQRESAATCGPLE
jgi:hypothetical protein